MALRRLRVDENSPFWEEFPSRAAATLKAIEEIDGAVRDDRKEIAPEVRKIDEVSSSEVAPANLNAEQSVVDPLDNTLS